MRQQQFLDVVDEATARARWGAACAHVGPRVALLPIAQALGRVLATDVCAPGDVPAFDRSDVDGFAVRAADTFGAEELAPLRLHLASLDLAAGVAPPPDFDLAAGTAVRIATGGVLPRGADAVLMVEHTIAEGGSVQALHAVAPGAHVTFAGSDVGRGETVLRAGQLLTPRETGLLAAIGVAVVQVFAPPRVAVLSTGDEVRAPGETLRMGQVHDANTRLVADAVREAGGEAVEDGIHPDDEVALGKVLRALVAENSGVDVIVLSGGTSKGAGDVNHRVVERLAREMPGSPGIVVHGVALKPGKPVCLAVVGRVPVVILPGFPASAVFTFHEFVAPLVRRLAGRRTDEEAMVRAVAPQRITSAVGRTEYTLVNLVEGPHGLAAYPLGAGSGSVSALVRADGFVRIPHDVEFVPEGAVLDVRLLGRGVRPADLVAIGSHCVGLDVLLGALSAQGFTTKAIAVGSQGGLRALERGEGDVAGVHLLDPATGTYNEPFLPAGVRLVVGYGRRQGFVFRRDDARFAERDIAGFVAAATASGVRMVNRNPGSGTRVLLDRLLGGARPDGSQYQVRSHHAVAAAVAQGRADWGMTLDVLAAANGLSFLFVQEERFDFAIPDARWDRPAVAAFRAALEAEPTRAELRALGLVVCPRS